MTSRISRRSERASLSAAVVLVVAAAAGPARAQSQADDARRHYRAGADLVRAANCREALTEFRASLDLVDSPNTRLLYARCLSETGDVATAVAEYARTQRDAEVRAAQETRFASTRDAARDEAAQLEARVGRIVLTYGSGGPPEHIVVAGREVTSADASAGIPALPGTVTIEARWRDGRSRTFTANTRAGMRTDLVVELPDAAPVTPPVAVAAPPSEMRERTATPHPRDDAPVTGPSVAVPIVLGALGVLGIAASGTMYSAAWGEYGANMDLCQTACSDEQLARGRGLEIGSYVALGVGSVLVIAGVVDFIVTRRAPASAHAHRSITARALTVRF